MFNSHNGHLNLWLKMDGWEFLSSIYSLFLLSSIINCMSIIGPKSYTFAIRCVELYKFLTAEKKEFILSKQVLRSGTAIGALIKESEHAQSTADFLNKMNIALKEANETEYWLMLLKDCQYLSEKEFGSIHKNCDELIRMLVSIVKTTKSKLTNRRNS